MTFHESGLDFTFFPQRWIVKKYDSHRFYTGLSGAGLKAVDFIGLLNRETLVLLEVKNYRDRPERELPRILEKIGEEKLKVKQSFTGKVRDTVQGIFVIEEFLQRKWLYRLVSPLLLRHRFLHRWAKADWIFWTLAAEAVRQKKLVLVLWLELDASYTGLSDSYIKTLRSNLAVSLTQQLADLTTEVFVTETINHPFEDSLVVTFAPSPPQ